MGIGDMVDKAKEMLTGAKDDAADKAGDAADKAKEKSGGVTDNLKDKSDDLINKAGDKVDDVTDSKYAKHVDKGQDMAKDAIDKMTS